MTDDEKKDMRFEAKHPLLCQQSPPAQDIGRRERAQLARALFSLGDIYITPARFLEVVDRLSAHGQISQDTADSLRSGLFAEMAHSPRPEPAPARPLTDEEKKAMRVAAGFPLPPPTPEAARKQLDRARRHWEKHFAGAAPSADMVLATVRPEVEGFIPFLSEDPDKET